MLVEGRGKSGEDFLLCESLMQRQCNFRCSADNDCLIFVFSLLSGKWLRETSPIQIQSSA